MELPHVGLHHKVPHLRKFEWLVDQQRHKVSKPLLLWPQRCHQNQRETGWKNSQQDLPEQSKRWEGIGRQMVPRVLERVLLLSHQVQNWRYVQRKLGIGTGGKEIEMGTTEHPTSPLKYPWKKRAFHGKNLVRTTEIVRQIILLPWNIPGHQGD